MKLIFQIRQIFARKNSSFCYKSAKTFIFTQISVMLDQSVLLDQ